MALGRLHADEDENEKMTIVDTTSIRLIKIATDNGHFDGKTETATVFSKLI
jgi:hypothetical protein